MGFQPTAVFDISQTDAEPFPELETAATRDAGDLVPALGGAANLGVDARVGPNGEWTHGGAEGVCQYDPTTGSQPLVEVKDKGNDASVAGTLVHEYAHGLLHDDELAGLERSKREVEAEAVAYVVGRHFGLDTSNSAFYLAAWTGDDTETLIERLGRISRTANTIIEAIRND